VRWASMMIASWRPPKPARCSRQVPCTCRRNELCLGHNGDFKLSPFQQLADVQPAAVLFLWEKPADRLCILVDNDTMTVTSASSCSCTTKAEFLARLAELAPDLCVTAAYGNILPQRFLDIPRFGTLNIHPSLLPAYRGAAPVQRALQVLHANAILWCTGSPRQRLNDKQITQQIEPQPWLAVELML